jgi:hypothetical protein
MTCVPTWLVDGCDGFSGPTGHALQLAKHHFLPIPLTYEFLLDAYMEETSEEY